MKNKFLMFLLLILVFGFGFIFNTYADTNLPKITKVTNMLSTQVKLDYELTSCEYEKCGIILLNENWVYKNNEAMVLRALGTSYKIYDGLNSGEVYTFRAAYYWFDDNGAYHNSAWSLPVTIKAQAPADKTVTDITITKEPVKTTYKVGEAFDPSGMIIKVTYNVGDAGEILDGKGCSFAPSVIASDTTSVKVTCENITKYQNITVNTSSSKTITVLQKIAEPIKTTYRVGDVFDPTGYVLSAEYEDGTSEKIVLKDAVSENICKVTPSGGLTENNSFVTVTCGNASLKLDIMVTAALS